MTARTSRGQHIIQGKRAKGQSNPSLDYLSSQEAARLIWPYFRYAAGFIRSFFKGIPTGSTHAAEFYKYAYKNGFTPDGLGGGTLDVSQIAYSKGTMTPTPVLTFTASAGGNAIHITAPTTEADASQLPTDVMWYVIRNLSQQKTISGSAFIRSVGTTGAGIVPPAGFLVVGNNLELWMNYVTDTGTVMEVNVSTSVSATVAVGA